MSSWQRVMPRGEGINLLHFLATAISDFLPYLSKVSVSHKLGCNVSTSRFSGRLTCFDNRISRQSSLKFSGYQEMFFAEIHFMPYWLCLGSDRNQMHNLRVHYLFRNIRFLTRETCKQTEGRLWRIDKDWVFVIRWTSSLVSLFLLMVNLSSSS